MNSLLIATLVDSLESLWSKKTNLISEFCSLRAIKLLSEYLATADSKTLKNANKWGQRAIKITDSNIIEATADALNEVCQLDILKGKALLIPYFIEWMNYSTLAALFNKKGSKKLADYLKRFLRIPNKDLTRLKEVDARIIAQKAFANKRINKAFQKISEDDLIKILKKMKRGIK